MIWSAIMKITTKWEPSEEEIHDRNLSAQKSDWTYRQRLNMESVHATLAVHSKTEPEKISALLGQEPDDVIKQGDSHEAGRFRIEFTETGWYLSTKDKVREKRPEAHITWLLDQIESNRQNLRHLQEAGARTSVKVHYYMHSWVQSTDLSVETLLRLARYRLSLQVMVHADDLQEEDE
jgi:hypothetical protein